MRLLRRAGGLCIWNEDGCTEGRKVARSSVILPTLNAGRVTRVINDPFVITRFSGATCAVYSVSTE